MILHDVTQGSPEWLALRAGIPTASCFDQILTPKGAISSSAKRYMHTLLAERIMGHPIVEHVSFWMQRGNELEAEALSYYESIRELDTTPVGFCTTDDGRIGASPDRLVGDEGLLEIKVPKEHTHVGYLLGEGVGADYRAQVQGQLWVTGRQWSDTLSYHPEMPPALVRVVRDEAYIALLSAAVEEFSRQLEAAAEKARGEGWVK